MRVLCTGGQLVVPYSVGCHPWIQIMDPGEGGVLRDKPGVLIQGRARYQSIPDTNVYLSQMDPFYFFTGRCSATENSS